MTKLQEFRQEIVRFVDGRRKRRQLEREFAQLAAMGSLDSVLADLGLSRSQIAPLIAGCADSPELLDKMLARLGIDATQLPVEIVRDMTWNCTTCSDKRQCQKWLADSEEADFHSFCPNAGQLDEAMLASPRAPLAGGGPKSAAYYPNASDLRRMHAEARQREVQALLGAAP